MRLLSTGQLFFTALIFVLLSFRTVHSQDVQEPFRVMFYNIENFFDIHDDTLTDDNSFLPGGVMKWNYSRYNKKLNSLYKTIVAAGDWNPPAVIAFCEIEKRNVLEDLVYNTFLSKFRYGIIHEESPDRRGIDVCLIYRKDLAMVAGYDYLIPDTSNFTSRSVLHARLIIHSDTIHFFINHWPSRRGGVLAGAGSRMLIAQMVKGKVDSILQRDNQSRIILLGDFNCTPDDAIIRSLIYSSGNDTVLINLSRSLAKNEGTYRYRGAWEMIDQVIVSKSLVYCNNGLYTSEKMLKILSSEFLLQKDPNYPGMTPYSTYRGYRYQGGYSDHLPVLLDLGVRHLPGE
jgi:predicted extracellular nuclease